MIGLPESEGRTIAVFVDRFTKIVHFFPYNKETTTTEYARLFVYQVFKLQGMLEVIISDRDLRFVSKFEEETFSLLGTDLRFSIAFHVETDGQLDFTIRAFENFLWPYIEHCPSTWTTQPPLTEFVVTNVVTISTRFTPFYLEFGQHLVIPTMLLARGQPKSSSEG